MSLKVRLIVGLFSMAIVGIPILGINLYALGAWEKFSRITESFGGNAADQGPPAPLGAVGLSFFDMVEGHKEAREIDAIFDADTPTKHRRMFWTQKLTIEDVLDPAETRPAPELERLYILARAPRFATQACAEMLGDMAKGCGFAGAEIDKGDKGVFELEVRIGFLPSDPVGDLANMKGAKLELERANSRDIKGVDLNRIPADRRAEAREMFRRLARNACDGLRERTGTCVITSLKITERPNPGIPAAWIMSATVTYAWLNKGAAPVQVSLNEPAEPEPTGVAGFFKSMKDAIGGGGGGSADAAPVAEKPVVRNGGGAFRGAGEGNFVKVGD